MSACVGMVVAGLATAAGGCEDGSERESVPPDPAGTVRGAAVRTLSGGPAALAIQVSSPTTAYSVRGAIDLATQRFRVRADVTSAPMTHFPKSIEVIGVSRETFEIVHGEPGFVNLDKGCAFDPHAPIGSLGGAVSVQETLALVGMAVGGGGDAPRTTTHIDRHARRDGVYRVPVEPSEVIDGDARRGDEWIVVNPPRLARHLAPMRVTVDSDGRIGRLSLELRRFPPSSRGPGIARERRRERVSVAVSLGDFGRRLAVKPPSCVAME